MPHENDNVLVVTMLLEKNYKICDGNDKSVIQATQMIQKESHTLITTINDVQT